MEVAVGEHPKHKFSQDQFNRVVQELRQLIKLPRVGAVGEIGLDHSVPREQWAQQSVMLEKILQLVEPGHVLVLHLEIPTSVTSAFSQLYFGFTSMAAKFNNQQSQAARGINPERVFLETDAPYFARFGTSYSGPHRIQHFLVFCYIKMNPESLLATSVQNARRLYRRL
ncbi:uncharacterized protein LOC110442871 [Mizuhopecten yessoensis]|uniref:uncharacterized protein LOC110442871 n=1 Tax=Mizuhopecten yessoensis TaxID=6573 RepID=UPI000B45DB78|nr:uncharacterized protein LOC110442871 [Mizuhopecten yessoensis]